MLEINPKKLWSEHIENLMQKFPTKKKLNKKGNRKSPSRIHYSFSLFVTSQLQQKSMIGTKSEKKQHKAHKT